jgi:hypothetical protein
MLIANLAKLLYIINLKFAFHFLNFYQIFVSFLSK